jgi:hypothetical protein
MRFFGHLKHLFQLTFGGFIQFKEEVRDPHGRGLVMRVKKTGGAKLHFLEPAPLYRIAGTTAEIIPEIHH